MKIKVNYIKKWDSQGCVVTKTIKLSKELLEEFNCTLKDLQLHLKDKRIISSDEMELLCYAKEITNFNKCLTHTQLLLLDRFLQSHDIDTKRILTDRNAMICIE